MHETIRKAHQVCPLTAVKSEYSLFERQIEEFGILNTEDFTFHVSKKLDLLSVAPLGV